MQTLAELAQEGAFFRSELEAWKSLAVASKVPLTPLDGVIAWSLYHTFSIYLHTMFLANPRWRELEITIPVLQPRMIAMHMDSLSKIISHALMLGDICPIIFLLPLYVAANAVNTVESRMQVRELLYQVRDSYCVVVNEDSQVLPFWTPNDSFHGQDTGNSLLKDRRESVLKHLRLKQEESDITVQQIGY